MVKIKSMMQQEIIERNKEIALMLGSKIKKDGDIEYVRCIYYA